MLSGGLSRIALTMIFSRFLPKASRRTQGALVILAALATFGAAAQEKWWGRWDADFDEDKKPWKEIEAQIPAYPRPENLLPFAPADYSPNRFFIDAQSLSQGEDGVMRYVLVVKTAGGATNVTFEGMRCSTRQQKYYAVGQPQGSWVKAKNAQWRSISKRDTGQHGALYDGYFCINPDLPTTPKRAIWQLKYGGSARYSPLSE